MNYNQWQIDNRNVDIETYYMFIVTNEIIFLNQSYL